MAATANANAQFSPITSTSGCGLFCSGQRTFASTVPVGGASLLLGTANSPVRLVLLCYKRLGAKEITPPAVS
jgi:hypothetical protein